MSLTESSPIRSETGFLEQGELVGGAYRVERQIGSGGMGAVFSAVDERSGTRVAVKWVQSGDRHAVSRERLVREWHLARQVRHPNVVEILDAGEERGSSYLVMELLEGDSLETWVVRGPYDPAFAIDLMMPAMRGVGAAHAAGIVHRDLKPQNVILERGAGGMRPTLIDFGISRATALGVYGDRKLTQHGITVGTPLYMAPEQLVGTQEADPQSDVYALGVILFELLAGTVPFESPADSTDLISEKIDRPALRLSEVLPDVDPRLDTIVSRALERSPSKRWGSVAELAKALEPFANARFDGDDPYYRGPSPLERPGTTLRVHHRARRKAPIALFVGLGLAAALLLTAGLVVGAILATPEEPAAELGPSPSLPPPELPPPTLEVEPTPEPPAPIAAPTPEAPPAAEAPTAPPEEAIAPPAPPTRPTATPRRRPPSRPDPWWASAPATPSRPQRAVERRRLLSRGVRLTYPRAVRVRVGSGLLFVCVLGHASAFAQDPPAGYAEMISEAVEEFSEGHWAEARVQFERAHALHPNARTLRGIGMCAFELADYPAAVSFLERSLGDLRRPLTEEQRDETQELLARARAYVGYFRLTTDPPGGELRIDDEVPSLDREGRVMLAVGVYALTARAPGHHEARQRLEVGGEDRDVVLRLRPAGLGEPPLASLALFVAGAAVWLIEPFSIGWWVDREGAVSSCASPPAGYRCDNAPVLSDQRDAAIATSVTAGATGLAVAAVGLVIWLAQGGDDDEPSACAPRGDSLVCRF